MASRIPALPRDSHVQSHAAVHKNKLCDSHAPLVARAIACGWTRPEGDERDSQQRGTQSDHLAFTDFAALDQRATPNSRIPFVGLADAFTAIAIPLSIGQE